MLKSKDIEKYKSSLDDIISHLEISIELIDTFKKSVERDEPWAFRAINDCTSGTRALDRMIDDLYDLLDKENYKK